MNAPAPEIAVRVWGDFACFTRPEMKVERVSYPLCTPSAARGILEAIFWEPEMFYVLDSIHVIRRGRWFSLRRNEVKKVINVSEAARWMSGKKPVAYIEAGGGSDDGAQRNMLGLAGVEYVLTAAVRLTSLPRAGNGGTAKYVEEIRRRASKGKCYHRPALGCREFAADFDWVEEMAPAAREDWTEDLGLMLYDVFDLEKRAAGFRWAREQDLPPDEQGDSRGATRRIAAASSTLRTGTSSYEGLKINPEAHFFRARVNGGVMDCHPDRVEVIRPSGAGETS
ncbi:MAG: type I-C CRISPR-associated protein Cas5c [Planctomycetota bacterium]